jgi:hypothetical protein
MRHLARIHNQMIDSESKRRRRESIMISTLIGALSGLLILLILL